MSWEEEEEAEASGDISLLALTLNSCSHLHLGAGTREAQMGRSIAESEDDSNQSSLELLWVLRC